MNNDNLKFYFTFGSDERFPFQYGWTEIEAPNCALACDIFQAYHPGPIVHKRQPDRNPEARQVHRLNCSNVYSEKEFKETIEYMQVNYMDRCHERIVVSRELLDGKEADS